MDNRSDSKIFPRKQEMLYGALAVRLGFTSKERVRECLGLQVHMKELGISVRRLGEILRAKGYLTDSQQIAIHEEQRGREDFPSLPGYRILLRIGKGAIGEVFRAVQTSMDREVAIKRLSPEHAQDPVLRARFLHEARVSARLSHPYIVQGIDVLEAGGHSYFVMEYIDGPTVGRLIREGGAIEEKRALRTLAEMASALYHAFRRGFIHRDIKPENILLTRSGVAKLCDLGLAKIHSVKREPQGQIPLRFIGTPYYASPEQAKGGRRLDTRSDIYSLGATFYHMITGQVPFNGDSPSAVLQMHVSDDPTPPGHVKSAITPEVESLVLKMMRKAPEERFQTPLELYREVERIRSHSRAAAAYLRKGRSSKPSGVGGSDEPRKTAGREERPTIKNPRRRT